MRRCANVDCNQPLICKTGESSDKYAMRRFCNRACRYGHVSISLRKIKVAPDPTWPKHRRPKLSDAVKQLKVARYLHENRERIIQMLAERRKTA